jgi:2-C-methyl-D-erythritol 2,4-cyclodiphosphate synthase
VHFPDTSSEFKNIDSKILLQKSFDLISAAGYRIINIDSTLCLELPKVKPYIQQMQETIAAILSLKVSAVSVKATTTERMGFIGREEGLAAYATILLESISQ